ncbi:MAG: hypothetical protein QOD49_2503 [Actinomycetota bacterium]|nr:hypothetical protein [Actinomycetota bacterium]
MPEGKRNFWTTVPGVISGVAAIVTGLGVLIPLLLGVGSKHTNTNTASQSPSPSVTSSTGTEGTTSTAGTGGPSPTDSLGSSPSASASAGATGATGISADPPSLSFGTVRVNGGTSDQAVTINNPGSVPVTIDHVAVTPSNPAFTITSTTCGDGSTVAPQSSCQIKLHFAPTALGSASASLEVHYHPPQSAFTSISLSGTGSLV